MVILFAIKIGMWANRIPQAKAQAARPLALADQDGPWVVQSSDDEEEVPRVQRPDAGGDWAAWDRMQKSDAKKFVQSVPGVIMLVLNMCLAPLLRLQHGVERVAFVCGASTTIITGTIFTIIITTILRNPSSPLTTT